MPAQIVVKRIEHLEQRVTALESMPHQIELVSAEISELRHEVRSEFSALRSQIQTDLSELCDAIKAECATSAATGFTALRDEIRTDFPTRADLRAGFATLRDEIRTESASRAAVEVGVEALRGELRGVDERLTQGLHELRAQMLTLHEDLIARLTLMKEGRPQPRKR